MRILSSVVSVLAAMWLMGCSEPPDDSERNDAKERAAAPAEEQQPSSPPAAPAVAQSPLRHLGRFEVSDIQLSKEGHALAAVIQGSRYIALTEEGSPTIHILRYRSGEHVADLQHDMPYIVSIDGHPTQPRLVIAGPSGVEAWSVSEQRRLWRFAPEDELERTPYRATLRPRDNDIIVVSPRGTLYLLDNDAQVLASANVGKLIEQYFPWHLACAPNGKRFLHTNRGAVTGLIGDDPDTITFERLGGERIGVGAAWVSDEHFTLIQRDRESEDRKFALSLLRWDAPDDVIASRRDEDVDHTRSAWIHEFGAFSYRGDELVYGIYDAALIRVVAVPSFDLVGDQEVDCDRLFGLLRRPRSNDFVSWGVKDGTVVVDKWRLR